MSLRVAIEDVGLCFVAAEELADARGLAGRLCLGDAAIFFGASAVDARGRLEEVVFEGAGDVAVVGSEGLEEVEAEPSLEIGFELTVEPRDGLPILEAARGFLAGGDARDARFAASVAAGVGASALAEVGADEIGECFFATAGPGASLETVGLDAGGLRGFGAVDPELGTYEEREQSTTGTKPTRIISRIQLLSNPLRESLKCCVCEGSSIRCSAYLLYQRCP